MVRYALCFLLMGSLAAAASAKKPKAKARGPEQWLKAHIEGKARGGLYHLQDRKLSFLRLDPEAARSPAKDRRVLRADFLEKSAEGEAQVSVDFTLKKGGSAWKVVGETLAGVDGEETARPERASPVRTHEKDPFLAEGESSPYAAVPVTDPFLTNPDGSPVPAPADPFADPKAEPDDPDADPFLPPKKPAKPAVKTAGAGPS